MEKKENSCVEAQKTRESVSKAYGDAISGGGGCCCGVSSEDNKYASKIGYEALELEELEGLNITTYGCGNPLAFSGVKEGEVVLDLGAGAGLDLLIAAKKVGSTGHVIGVDMTDKMLETARQNIKASGLTNVEVRKGLIEDLPVDSGTVDWVISNCVINLSPEKERVFTEISRVLRPGGRILVSDIVAEDLPDWMKMADGMYNNCISGAVSEDEYLKGLQAAGLTDVKVVERYKYTADDLEAFINSDDLPSEITAGGKEWTLEESPVEVARGLAGKVWSSKFSALKS